jgi:hypothetical protein
MIRVLMVCRPAARATVDAALASAGLGSEVAWVQWPQPATIDEAMPVARIWWCGWQGAAATATAMRAALSGVPGWRAFRGRAVGTESSVSHPESDDDAANPDPITDRITRRAAIVVAARQMSVTLGGDP